MHTRPLRIFNSDGRRLEEFQPRQAGRASLYTCGLTVYNYAHIGNLRPYVFADTLRRALQLRGLDVLHVMNITDVGHLTSDADEGDDKMEQAALRRGKSVWELAAHFTQAFLEDIEAMRVLPPSVLCKATEHVQEMIAFAERIQRNGYAYELPDGLYFDTGRLPEYGRMALLDTAGLRAGARVAQAEGKRHVTDFVLWRRSPDGARRLMEWSSPWGPGAPGWHLECSAMSIKYLGERFDLHTGGIDHRQVHHPNEVAQNEGFLGGQGEPSVRYWMHNEFLLMGDEKMSKSSGRFLRLRTLRDDGLHPASYRYFLLGASYRKPIEYGTEAVVGAQNGLLRVLRRIEALKVQAPDARWHELWAEHTASRGGALTYLLASLCAPLGEAARRRVEQLDEALSNDLNTPQALAHLGELLVDPVLRPDEALRLVAVYDLALGLDLPRLTPADLSLRPAAAGLDEAEVHALVAEREAARKARDFKRADELRQRLAAAGVALKDSREGTTWEWSAAAAQRAEP